MDAEVLKQTIMDANACYVAGMQAAQAMSPDRVALNAIIRAYDRTKDGATIPSALMCAIEAARKV